MHELPRTMSIVVALALLLAAGRGQAAKQQVAEPGIASSASAAEGPTRIRCIRDREIGSNRIKRICLPEEQLKRLSREEIVDLIRSDKSPAELLGR